MGARSAAVTVYPDRAGGPIKPMHAVNNTPVVPYDDSGHDLFGKMRDAGIPYVRTHDTGGRYGGSRYVDVGNLFPRFEADESDPASYDFAFTDRLFEEIVRYGMRPFFRLGATIENFHAIKAYRIFPPADFGKWARVCEHIIRHYNEGWADGYRLGIEYWEIWNEPDNMPEIRDNPMWKGTPEQFFEFYDVVSTYLKGRFPDLRVGGYGSCGFYAVSGADPAEAARVSGRTGHFLRFLDRFLAYVAAHGRVLDFFSWHSYASPWDNVRYAAYARRTLDDAGFPDARIFLDEWNPCPDAAGSARDASAVASCLCLMQRSPTDMCMYYDARISSGYCGLFNFYTRGVFPAYYAFYGFNRLYRLGSEMPSESDAPDVCVCAARNGRSSALMIVNGGPDPVSVAVSGFPLDGAVCHATDGARLYEPIAVGGRTLELSPYGVYLLERGPEP